MPSDYAPEPTCTDCRAPAEFEVDLIPVCRRHLGQVALYQLDNTADPVTVTPVLLEPVP